MAKKKKAAKREFKKLPRVAYKKILYPTDLSDTGRCAFPYAASIAHQYGAQLTVFHVLETVEFERTVVGYISEDMWKQIKKRSLKEARDILVDRKREDTSIRDTVDRYCRESLAGGKEGEPYVTYEVLVKAGDTVERILQEAHKGDYDLMVLGKKGQRALKDTLIGTTARRVIRRCNIPVMVVPLAESEECKLG
ncbi:MAG: universal stress protein [Gammaproteobacteria bacterium]|nr:universal stress protein [Gammaproteobacteria bacterium]